MSFPKAHRTVLPNGLRVVIIPMKNNPTVTVEVLVETGSYYEEKRFNGISHFLEHMCFKGTPTRPSALAINHAFDSLGAANNAFTGKEATGYWAKARTKHLEHIVDLVSDVYLHPLLPKTEFEKERGVIIQEINMYEDTPDAVVDHLKSALLYGNQAAGRPISGTKESVSKMKRADLIAYQKKHYIASKTAVIIAGNVTPQRGLALVKKYFHDVDTGKKPMRVRVTDKQTTPRIAARHKKIEQTHLVLSFRTLPRGDSKEHYALAMLTRVLGKGMSSRLFQKLREEMGVCYYVGAGSGGTRDVGTFSIRAGVDTKRLEEVVSVLLEELRKIKNEDVPKKELAKVKEYSIGKKQMGLETSDALADWYGDDEISGLRLMTPEEDTRRVLSVTARDIRKAAQKFFRNERMNLAIVGPHANTLPPRLKKLLTL